MTIDAHRREQAMRYVRPVGAWLARLGLTANVLTAVGLLFALAAAASVLAGRFLLAGVLLALGGIADLFDGSVARARGGTTVLGGFYDSVSDRLADGLVLSAIAWTLRGDPALFAAAVVALVAAEVTSYTRAKAESVGLECAVGLLERAERTVILVAGLVFHTVLLEIAIVVLAVGASVTVVQRVVHVRRSAREAGLDRPAPRSDADAEEQGG
jgi:CDP-diacylglycerol---glycerol-3-phosphate 3-phosphatidyltransferase